MHEYLYVYIADSQIAQFHEPTYVFCTAYVYLCMHEFLYVYIAASQIACFHQPTYV